MDLYYLQVNIFEWDLVLVPVLNSNHWSLLAYSPCQKMLVIMDSVNSKNQMDFLAIMEAYLKKQSIEVG